jgi:hypothetical protein
VSEPREALLKIVAVGVALVALLALGSGSAITLRWRRPILRALVALGALGYVNFGALGTDGTLLHVWDQFHYVLGSKYYPELGYDGIYVAALAARREKDPTFVPPSRIRDLRTNDIVPTDSLASLEREVRARFSPARWAEFRDDATRFYMRDEIFIDHGYLATPTHAAISRLLCGWLPFRHRTLVPLAMVDFVLLAVAGALVYGSFGLETLAAVALIFGLGYCSRFYWVGGAFLRMDWLAALVAAGAALKRGSMRVAGAAIAYATCVRIFPGLVLAALAVAALASYRRDRRARPWLELAGAFVATATILVTAGAFAGRGAHAWLDFARAIRVHAAAIGPNAIGVPIAFIGSLPNLRGDLIDPTSLYNYARVGADYALRAHERAPIIFIAVAGVVGLALRVAWRHRDPVVALACGVALIYALTTPSCYYGSFFVLLGLLRPLRTAALFLAATAPMYMTHLAVTLLVLRGVIRLNGAAVYVPVSALLAIVLVAWLLGANRAADPARQARRGAQVQPGSEAAGQGAGVQG